MNNLNNISNRFKFVRELAGESQQFVASAISMPQPSYARYESGLTKKIPYTKMNSFANHFGIDIEWLNNGVVNRDACNSICDLIRSKNVDTKKLVKIVGVSEAFLESVMACEISPSKEFYNSVMEAVGINEDHEKPVFGRNRIHNNIAGVDNKVAYLQFRIDKLNEEIMEKEDLIDKLFSENERLKKSLEDKQKHPD